MKPITPLIAAFAMTSFSQAQILKSDIPYADPALERQVLDIYARPGAKNLPVVFWIHGGGWQSGDKANVKKKPEWFMGRGFVFASINHRFLPDVEMDSLIRDVALALGWVHRNVPEYGGDPKRILVGGHSSGAQLAAIISTDERYLNAVGVTFESLIGCVTVDGDTYDIPAIIETAETRRRVHHQSLPTFGHRQKFGDDPAKHLDFSAVTHVRKGKGIPPFLILYNSAHPDNSAQGQRFGAVLKASDIPATLFAGKNTDHVKLNDDLGLPGDEATKVLEAFVARIAKQ